MTGKRVNKENKERRKEDESYPIADRIFEKSDRD